ncbi:MAG TPA: helix-turn-helix transcriptional regulator [Firmicutes bacterium]|nr:helix-turn-helix transcriptional regulator [Bacillota bacterium]
MLERKTLSDLRNQLGLSQRKLAKLLNLKPSTIAMYELGLRTPPLNTAKRIAAFFGVNVEAIYFGYEARILRAKATGTDG